VSFCLEDKTQRQRDEVGFMLSTVLCPIQYYPFFMSWWPGLAQNPEIWMRTEWPKLA